MALSKLQTLQSRISSPFISCEFGGETFGLRQSFDPTTRTRDVRYVTSLTADKKASGAVNSYNLSMTYLVSPGMDPNYIDMVISKAKDRKIYFTYGDTSQPEYYYVREQAIITNIVPQIDFSRYSLTYTISATSSVALGYTVKRTYPEHKSEKPSNIIIDLLYSTDSPFLNIFPGMRDKTKVLNSLLIPRNDEYVYIEETKDISPLDYLRVLVSKMTCADGSFYALLIHDEPDNIDGPYFEIVNSVLHQGKGNHYSVDIDVGYPSDTPIYSFVPSQNTSLALITSFQEQVDKPQPAKQTSQGAQFSPALSIATKDGKVAPEILQWWKTMTAYPINATLRTRGLLKPAVLCDYLHINIYFFGIKYNYSGYYMITGQKDTIDSSGYSTELSLVRVQGEDTL